MIRVLFVCSGNICRSPMAEGIFRRMLRERGLEAEFEVDSAGTGAWHVGEEADPRAKEVLQRHGADFPHIARQLQREDDGYDYLFAMDKSHLEHLYRMFPQSRHKIRLLLGNGEVPDPYYGGLEGFEEVYQMLEGALRDFLEGLGKGSSR